MTGRAVARKQAFAKRLSFGVLRQLDEVHGGELLVDGFIGFGSGLHFCCVLTFRRPAQHALVVAEARVGDHVANGPGDGDEIQVEPPFRGRVIPLLDVAVPLVADKVIVGNILRSLLSRPSDQPDTPNCETNTFQSENSGS